MKRKRKYTTSSRITIYEEFCVEMDLFSTEQTFPDWIFDFRENHLSKVSNKLIKFCRKLKQNGIEFKILYPMEIYGKWKFADVYIPSKRTVVMVNTLPHSPGYLSQRASFFLDRCKVYELDGMESEEKLDELISKLR